MRTYLDTPFHEGLRKRLVHGIRAQGITDERVLHAIETVPRHFFLPPRAENSAYLDKPFPIGEGQTISQPYTVAYQTQLLDLRSTDKVLEIGTGSAYQAVVLAELAGEVYTVERQKKLYENNLGFAYLKMFNNLHLFFGDGYEGLPRFAPFDRILITAAAPEIPPALIDQLKPGGKLVLPLGRKTPQRMIRITKDDNGKLEQEDFGAFTFVPMLTGKKE